MSNRATFGHECLDCQFFVGIVEDAGHGRPAAMGHCRRFPPNAPAPDGHEWRWPHVFFNSWCGEFVRHPEIEQRDSNKDRELI